MVAKDMVVEDGTRKVKLTASSDAAIVMLKPEHGD